MTEATTALAAIAAEPPEIPAARVAEAVSAQFGLRGELTPLISERDQNFQLTADDGCRYVAKVVSRADTPELIDFQISALKHLKRRAFERVPRVVHTLAGPALGEIEDDDGAHLVLRLVTWVDGELRLDGELSSEGARNLGRTIAELDVAFEGFHHRGENQSLLWDLRRAPELVALTEQIDDSVVRHNVEVALRSFVEHTAEALAILPSQVIHSDVNGGNVLYDDANGVAGIIDFGDMLSAPRIIDPAIAAAYLRDVNEPLRLITAMLAGYSEVVSIGEIEKSIFFDLVRARLCTTITMLHWRVSERPTDNPYRVKTIEEESGAGDFLVALNNLGREEFNRLVLGR